MSKPDPNLELLGDPAALKALLSSPETQKLVSLLNQAGGSSLQSAAKAAATGKPDALMGILNQVMGSPEGAQAAQAFQKKTQKSQ